MLSGKLPSMTPILPYESARPRRSVTSILFGLFLAAAGSLFVASNLELLPFQPTVVNLTPALIAIVAIDRFLAGRRVAALAWLGIGGLLTYALVVPEFDLGELIRDGAPVIIVLIGVVIVLRALGVMKSAPAPGGQGDLAFFGTLKNRPEDPAYLGGSCIAVLGGHRLDLRGSELSEDGAVLQIFVLWGGIDITVPESWTVSAQVFATLGGAGDKTRPPNALPAGLPRLVVRGVVVMGGLEVHN